MTTENEIDDYLTRYAATLTAFDSKAAAGLWATPGMIVDDNFAGVLNDRDSMAQGLEQSYPLYRELGLASVTHQCLEIQHLTDAITLLKVRWHFLDAAGDELTDSNAYYLLRHTDEGPQACVCIQTDDAQKLQALAVDRGVDLSKFTADGA